MEGFKMLVLRKIFRKIFRKFYKERLKTEDVSGNVHPIYLYDWQGDSLLDFARRTNKEEFEKHLAKHPEIVLKGKKS